MSNAVTDHTCGLCNFDLIPGEQVAALAENGECTEIFTYSTHHARAYLCATLHVCTVDQGLRKCHLECVGSDPPSTLKQRLSSAKYAFEPSLAERARREKHIHAELNSKLHLPGFPFEIRHLVAKYLLSKYVVLQRAIRFDEANWSNPHSSRLSPWMLVSLGARIWAEYTVLDGRAYIYALSNREPTGAAARRSRLVFEPSKRVLNLFVASDHLGVRNLAFSRDPPGRCPENVYWLTHTLSGIFDLKVYRDVTLVQSGSPPGLYWPIPLTGRPPIWHAHLDEDRVWADDPGGPSFVTDYRVTDTAVGVSVLWTFHTVTIRSHSADEDTSFYRDYEDHHCGAWFFMPLDKGEFVTRIWIQTEEQRLDQDGVPIPRKQQPIILATNRDRVKVMGPFPRWYGHQVSSRLVCHYLDPGHRFFVARTGDCVSDLAFEQPFPRHQEPPEIPGPVTPDPVRLSFFKWRSYSAAQLDRVVKITPCRMKMWTRWIIGGLLLEYANGHTDCVGMIRLDCLGTPLEVGCDQGIALTFTSDSNGPHVSRVQVEDLGKGGPSSAESILPSWRMVCRMQGLLEWWFSTRQVQIYHGGSASPLAEWFTDKHEPSL